MRLLFAAMIALILGPLQAHADADGYEAPAHEVWLGIGGAAAFEKDIFNVPSDIESSPDLAISLGYLHNLDERSAVGFHIYGTTEETPTVYVVDAFGNIVATSFTLDTFNIGMRGRRTFSRGLGQP